MIKKKFLLLQILLLFTVSALTINITRVSAVEYPIIYIDPATILDPTLTSGERFMVSIETDYEGTDIWSYRFTLTYNPSVLKGINVVNGDLITKERNPDATVHFFPGEFDNTVGSLLVTLCNFKLTPGAAAPLTYGSGTLANVTFEVVSTGTSDITLGPITRLAGITEDGYGDYYPIIDAETMSEHIHHGFFSNLFAVYADPATTLDTSLMPDENYTISIKTNYNGTDVWGYEFTLTYDSAVLEGISVTNGDLITEGVSPITWIPGVFNNVNGELSLTGAKFDYLTPPAPQTHGPGTLANITFTVVGIGDSDIILGTETAAPSRLIGIDEFGEPYNIIDHTPPDRIYHGYFDNTLRRPPLASFTYSPEEPAVSEIVIFNASASYDPDPEGAIVSYKWNFGDGTTKIYVKDVNLTATTTHAYTELGTYMVNLTVTDLEDKTDTTTRNIITVEITEIHDIAVANVTVSPDTVKIGESVSINVTVTNQGHYLETFNLTVYVNTTLINQTQVIVASGSSTAFTVTWDTAGTAKGDYTIKAEASIVEGETDIDDNTYTDGVVTVQEAPPPDILLYAAVAAATIIVIALIALYALKLRKTKLT